MIYKFKMQKINSNSQQIEHKWIKDFNSSSQLWEGDLIELKE